MSQIDECDKVETKLHFKTLFFGAWSHQSGYATRLTINWCKRKGDNEVKTWKYGIQAYELKGSSCICKWSMQ